MKRKITILILLFSLPFIFTVLFLSCTRNDNDLKVNLRWIKGYPDENWEKVRCGFLWSMSFLGAELPKGSFDNSITRKDSSCFTLDLAGIGFTDKAQSALSTILVKIKESEEYKATGAIDIGRFLLLTVYSSRHYYAITGVYNNLDQFRSNYNITDPLKFPVVNSGVSEKERLVKFNSYTNWRQYAFVAEEGDGSFKNKSFKKKEVEVFDFMPNGQPRFAIYNEAGKLKLHADPLYTQAGKPGKCMWCHESTLTPIVIPTEEVHGYMGIEEFGNYILTFRQQLKAYRDSLNCDINFNNLQDHTQSELLYISFMEPSLLRIANEWKMDTSSAKKILKDLPVHVYEEFPFLGKLYHRKDIDKLSPYKCLPVPESVREKSEFEPDYFRKD
jgi:hypothetical protein